jgi:hypothetical protein
MRAIANVMHFVSAKQRIKRHVYINTIADKTDVVANNLGSITVIKLDAITALGRG